MRIKILNLDGMPDSQGEVFDPAGVVLAEGAVPVRLNYSDESKDCVGWATLEKTEDGVYATIESLRPGAEYLYPGAHGVVTDFAPTFNGSGHRTITRCEIRGIGVHMTRNCDYRIQTIEEQLKDSK